MVNFTLYKREMKKSRLMLVIFACIMTVYISTIISMFDPEMMSMLDEWAEVFGSMMAAVGMTAGATTLLGFMSSYLYGFILIVIPMIFSILCANRLLAGYTDKGSMACLLSAPVKRRTVALTQLTALGSGIFLLVLFASILEIAVAAVYFPGGLDVGGLLLLNLGLLCLQCFVGGICFFFSALANDTKYSIGFGAGIPALMFVLQMLGNVGEKAKIAKYFTFFTLFDPEKLIAGKALGIAGILILLAGAAALFAAAVEVFSKKDLHI